SDQPAQRAAFDEFGRDEMRAARFRNDFADLVNGNDVRMIERGGGARLLAEAMDALGIFGEMRRQQFERDLTAQPRVARQIHLAHSSARDLADQVIMPDRLSVTRISRRHQIGGQLKWRGVNEIPNALLKAEQ